jgi:hypothetical protein
VQLTLAKKFAHVLLAVYGKILQLKLQFFNFFNFFGFAYARNGRFEHFFEKNDLRPLGVKLEFSW